MSTDKIIEISNIFLKELEKKIPNNRVLYTCLRDLFHEQKTLMKMYENGTRISEITKQLHSVNHIIESILIHLCNESSEKNEQNEKIKTEK